MRTRRNVGLTANDWFDPSLLRLLIKFDGSEEIAVIGHRYRWHPEFPRFFHQLFHPDGAIKQRILGVEVKMNEGIHKSAEERGGTGERVS